MTKTWTASSAEELFEQMKKQLASNMSEEQQQQFQRLGEKFHGSFDITKGQPYDWSTIKLEEVVAYIVESLKSGLHPRYLTEEEQTLLEATYGNEWYTKWGYGPEDVSSSKEEKKERQS